MVRKLWHGAAFIVLLLLLITSMVMVPSRVQADKGDTYPSGSPLGAGDQTVTNGYYIVTVSGDTAFDAGAYTVQTGALHPQPFQNILYGDGSPGTSYNTVRILARNGRFEYCQGTKAASPFYTQVDINNAGVVKSVIAAGNIITTTWDLTNSTVGPVNAIVTQVTAVEGTTITDSRVRVTTTVTNTNPPAVFGPIAIGIRYLWDIKVALNDAAIFQQLNPDSAWLDVETTSLAPPLFYTNYQITDDAVNPTFKIQGSVTAPTTFSPLPTPPDRVSFASWSGSYSKAFDYVSGSGLAGDSAILYYWGGHGGMGTTVEAINVAAGESYSVTQYLYTIPGPSPTVTTGDPTAGLTCVSATLSGTLANVAGLSCQCFDVYFEYGNTPGNLDQETAHEQLCRPNSTFTHTLALMPCMTYYYRAVAVCSPNNFANNNGLGFAPPTTMYGKEVAFNTMMCCTSKTSSGGGSGWELTSTRPYLPPMFDIPSATVSATKAAPGEQVEVNATVTNKGGSNGTTKIILYVNGQEADSKGIALSSGQSTPVSFKVSRNDPGTYSVYVNGTSAGSFTVDLFNTNDVLIYCSIALFVIGLIGLLYYLNKRRTAA